MQCNLCKNTNFRKHGTRLTRKGKVNLLQCLTCGHTQREEIIKEESEPCKDNLFGIIKVNKLSIHKKEVLINDEILPTFGMCKEEGKSIMLCKTEGEFPDKCKGCDISGVINLSNENNNEDINFCEVQDQCTICCSRNGKFPNKCAGCDYYSNE